MKTKPVVSIIIPTRNSQEILAVTLRSIRHQNCSRKLYEVIVADNQSQDKTVEIAEKYGAKVIKVKGKPPKTSSQRNLAANISKGDYIFYLDHDIELSPSLIGNFVELIKGKKKNVDAWYVPYKIIARGKLLTKVRNFEEQFYVNSVVAAARIIKKETFWKTGTQFDASIDPGPADWDLNLQLILINAKFDYIKDYVYHHEENLTLWQFVSRKVIYSEGGEIYKKKWRRKNPEVYKNIVKKQYDPFYRLFWIFIEKGKWKKLILNIHHYIMFLIIKVTTAVIYYLYLKTRRFSLVWRFRKIL